MISDFLIKMIYNKLTSTCKFIFIYEKVGEGFMTLKIGEKIKQLRKKADVTQEKFAEYLGVTFQAVSRWESGICYPDIEIVPSIANFFNVTTDELLGVDIMYKQEKRDETFAKLYEKQSKGLIDECIEMTRTAINEFPNDYELLAHLAFLLGKKDETMKEAISINERILADCTDDQIRYGVMQKLAYHYNLTGEKEKAIHTAKKLPSTPVTCDMLLRHIYDGEEKILQLQSNIPYFCDYITSDIVDFARAKYYDDKNDDVTKQRIKLYKKAINIYEIIYEDGDYGFYNERMSDLYLRTASNYIILNDFDNAFDYLEKAMDYAIAFDTLPEVFTHTSMISEGKEFIKVKNLSKNYNCNDSYLMLHDNNYLPNERYNPIRETERFKAVVAKLEQYAEKEE